MKTKGEKMSLRKGLSLLLLVAFSLTTFAPVSAAVTVASSNTTSTTLEAYVLPGNSTAGSIVTQHPSAAAGQNEVVKGISTLAITAVNGNTISGALEAVGKSLYTTFQPAYSGSNQVQNVNVLVCETAASAFAANQDYFVALPSGWNLNLENGADAYTSDHIYTTAVSNGITLNGSVANDVQLAAGSQVAGINIEIATAGSTTGNERACFNVNIQHENLIGPSSGSSPKLSVYKLVANGSTTTEIIGANGDSSTTEHLFAADSSILTQAATVELAAGSDIVNDFVRTGTATTPENSTEKLAAGAIAQDFDAVSSITRYQTAGAYDIYGLVVTESHAGAWAALFGPSSTVPNSTADVTHNGDSLNEIVITCETNGTNAHLTGSGVITPLTADLDVEDADATIAATSDGELVIDFAKKSDFLGDANDTVSKFLVTGLQFANITGSTSTSIECLARARRTSEADANGDTMSEGFGLGEGLVVNGTSTTFVAIGTNNGNSPSYNLNGWALGAADIVDADNANGVLAYDNNEGSTQNGSTAYFSAYSSADATIAGALVLNGTTALKTVSSTTKVGVTVADLPSDSSATGDTDKLVTVTVAQNSLSAGIPLTLSSQTSTDDGEVNTVKGAADANGGAVLSIRAKNGQTLLLTGASLGAATATKEITANTATITPEFLGTVTSDLDGDDGFVKRGKDALLVFTLNNGNTVGFDFDDVVADAKLNGAEIISFGNQKYGAFVNPAASVFQIKVTVDGTALTQNVTISTAFATPGTKSKRHGGMKVADRRASGKGIVFRPQRRKFLDATRVIEIDDEGTVTEALVTLRRKRTRAKVDGGADTDFVCVTSDRQTNCFDLR